MVQIRGHWQVAAARVFQLDLARCVEVILRCGLVMDCGRLVRSIWLRVEYGRCGVVHADGGALGCGQRGMHARKQVVSVQSRRSRRLHNHTHDKLGAS